MGSGATTGSAEAVPVPKTAACRVASGVQDASGLHFELRAVASRRGGLSPSRFDELGRSPYFVRRCFRERRQQKSRTGVRGTRYCCRDDLYQRSWSRSSSGAGLAAAAGQLHRSSANRDAVAGQRRPSESLASVSASPSIRRSRLDQVVGSASCRALHPLVTPRNAQRPPTSSARRSLRSNRLMSSAARFLGSPVSPLA